MYKAPLLYRMCCRSVRGTASAWERGIVQPFDAAVKKNSALLSGLKHNFVAEVCALLGQTFWCNLSDFEKLLDAVDPTVLVRQALDCEYTLNEFSIGLQQH